MKKQIVYLLSGLMTLLTVSTAMAGSVQQCMRQLPDTISFIHIKDPMRKTDSFVNYEKDYPGQGLGYSQSYVNELCMVSVFVYNLNLKKITANDINIQQEQAEQDMLKMLSSNRETVDQVYVTSIGNNFLKLRATCGLLYSGEEARYNEMLTRVVSATVEEQVSASLNSCLK